MNPTSNGCLFDELFHEDLRLTGARFCGMIITLMGKLCPFSDLREGKSPKLCFWQNDFLRGWHFAGAAREGIVLRKKELHPNDIKRIVRAF